MNNPVLTTKGMIALDELEVRPVVQIGDNSVIVAIEYYHNGELVKRSVHLDVLRPIEAQAVAGSTAAH